MWEKTRQDCTRKLKCNAVPTIFISFIKAKPKRKPPAERKLITSKRKAVSSCMEVEQLPSSESAIYTNPTSDLPSMTCEVAYKKILARVNRSQNELQKIKRKFNTIMRQNQDYIENLQSQKILKKVFNQNQIDTLTRSSTRF